MNFVVKVSVGIGAWTAYGEIQLVAAPHVGDQIVWRDEVITCDRVTIGYNCVWVEETRRWSEEDAKEFQKRVFRK